MGTIRSSMSRGPATAIRDSGYVDMTAGLRFPVCLQEAGWNQAKREEFSKLFSYHPYNFLKMDPAKYTTNLFNPG